MTNAKNFFYLVFFVVMSSLPDELPSTSVAPTRKNMPGICDAWIMIWVPFINTV